MKLKELLEVLDKDAYVEIELRQCVENYANGYVQGFVKDLIGKDLPNASVYNVDIAIDDININDAFNVGSPSRTANNVRRYVQFEIIAILKEN